MALLSQICRRVDMKAARESNQQLYCNQIVGIISLNDEIRESGSVQVQ